MTKTQETHKRSDRRSDLAAHQAGEVHDQLEHLAAQQAAHNPDAKRTIAADLIPRYRGTRFASVGID